MLLLSGCSDLVVVAECELVLADVDGCEYSAVLGDVVRVGAVESVEVVSVCVVCRGERWSDKTVIEWAGSSELVVA